MAVLSSQSLAHLNHSHDTLHHLREWSTSSFQDFSQGTFDDSGVNAYVSADGSLRLINLWDLNDDGWLDIVLPNTHGYKEVVDATLFFGSEEWSHDAATQLPSNGGMDMDSADFDRDGYVDLVLVNRFNGTRTDLISYIYWGGPEGFNPESRMELPTRGAYAATHADLNGDGYPEILFANSGLGYHVADDSLKRSYLYWNNAGAFSSENRFEVKTINARDVAVGDLNKDGVPDLAFAQEGNTEGEGGVVIFYGKAEGTYSKSPDLHLPGERSQALLLQDLNKDGWIDITLANPFRLSGREGGIYNRVDTGAIPSVTYWGSANGFSTAEKTLFPTVHATDVAAGDLNNDQWPDLVFANSKMESSFIYWGAPGGFQPHNRTAWPGGPYSRVEIRDLNKDGFEDLLLAGSGGPGNTLKVFWGSADGLSDFNRMEVPIENPGGLLVSDLDGDRIPEVGIANQSQPPRLYPAPTFIYPGSIDGFLPGNRVTLPTHGVNAYSAADFNADGYVDLFMPEEQPTLYWGSDSDWEYPATSTLSSQYAFSGRTADFNKDGYLDIVLSEWSPGITESHVYYGSPTGYTPAFTQKIPIQSARFHAIADLNADGWIDLLFPDFIGEKIVIYFNGPLGFDTENPALLSVKSAVAIEIADLDGDTHPEVIVPNLFDKNPEPGEDKPRSFGGSPQGNTYIFKGTPEGPDPDNPTILPSIGAEDALAADFNRDGLLDLVLTSYHAGHTRSLPSYLYWGTPEGFHSDAVERIPTHSASGVHAADYNQDGWPDLLFANHSRDGSHENESWLYWNQQGNFSEKHRLSLPGLGPHMLTVADAGHLLNRGFHWNYVSAPYFAGDDPRYSHLNWEGSTPHRTRIALQLRTAESKEELDTSPWRGPKGADSYWEQPNARLSESFPQEPWIQFRAVLISPDSANSPVLRSVSVSYQN